MRRYSEFEFSCVCGAQYASRNVGSFVCACCGRQLVLEWQEQEIAQAIEDREKETCCVEGGDPCTQEQR